MVSIVIPAFNEEKVLAETVNSVFSVFEKAARNMPEIVVVDDGSTDQTSQVCAQLNVVTVRNPLNMGYGFSLKQGILKATYDTVIIIDADNTYPAEQIPLLLDTYNKGFDMVVGARQGRYYESSMLKKWLRFFLKMLVEYTTNNKIPDINSGLRVFSKKEIIKYHQHLSNAFSFTTSVTLVYLLNQKFVKYVPIPYNKRTGVSKVKIIRDILRTLQYIFEIILYYNPVKVYILAILLAILQVIVFEIIHIEFGGMIARYMVLGGIIAIPVFAAAAMLAMQLKHREGQKP